MCTPGGSRDLILSHSAAAAHNEAEEEETSYNEPSVLVVELDDMTTCGVELPQSTLDEDLLVTFSRRAEVLPHARYDCPIHPFRPTDTDTTPVATNRLFCDQCFCYICDKPALQCTVWCRSGRCHCNSHKKSELWLNLRRQMQLRGLRKFNLSVREMDAALSSAEAMLQSFREELSELFSAFVKGQTLQGGVVHDYTPVFSLVSSFLSRADEQEVRAAAVMRLGAAEDFIQHFQPSGTLVSQSPLANAAQAKLVLLQRVVASVQQQMVKGDFSPEFTVKLQDYYKTLCFPAELRSMRNSLSVRPRDDFLLVSVLTGRNVWGIHRKDVLMEPVSVVLLRTEVLQQQSRYTELCRYLRVIQTDDSKALQQLHDLIPFFKCMDGNLTLAVHSLFPPVNAPATRLTPLLFLFYLRVFGTAAAPKLTVTQPVQLCCSSAPWEPIKGAVPLKRAELVKFALRAQTLCSAVFMDSQCWTRLLSIINTPRVSIPALPAPPPHFLHSAKDIVNCILQNMDGSKMHIPAFFEQEYPDQALLLLVTGALCWRILHAALRPALPVLGTFKENVWALEWLGDSLGPQLKSFIQDVKRELETCPDRHTPFPHPIILALLSSANNWDQWSCT